MEEINMELYKQEWNDMSNADKDEFYDGKFSNYLQDYVNNDGEPTLEMEEIWTRFLVQRFSKARMEK